MVEKIFGAALEDTVHSEVEAVNLPSDIWRSPSELPSDTWERNPPKLPSDVWSDGPRLKDAVKRDELPQSESGVLKATAKVDAQHLDAKDVSQESKDTTKSGEGNTDAVEQTGLDKNPEQTGNREHCPIDGHGGHWEGERGNSKWVPDEDYVPQKQNPEQKHWNEILGEYGIDGISYEDGEPNFGEVSKGDVEIEDFSADRSDNFDKADIELAKQRGGTPEEVAKWRKENGYTWHECRDMRTMQKVPSKVHNNVSHSGGVSEIKKRNGEQL